MDKKEIILEKIKPVYLKVEPYIKKLLAILLLWINKLKEKYPVLRKYLKLPESGKGRAILAYGVAAAVIFVSVFGIFGALTDGEKINTKKAVKEYNQQVPDTSYLYKASTEQEIGLMIDELDSLLSQTIAEINIENLLYCDETASLLGRFIGELSGEDFDEVSFRKLKKDYPEAYARLTDMQLSSASWEHIDTIPFGIAKGDKDAFVKACGAFCAFLGNEMLNMVLKSPSVYNNALVPALESLQTGKMPTLTGFVLKTGLDGSARVELIIEKVLTIIDPIKEAPLTYLCTMLPDFIVNYTRACDFINSRSLGLELPEIEDILDSVFSFLGMT